MHNFAPRLVLRKLVLTNCGAAVHAANLSAQQGLVDPYIDTIIRLK